MILFEYLELYIALIQFNLFMHLPINSENGSDLKKKKNLVTLMVSGGSFLVFSCLFGFWKSNVNSSVCNILW